MDYDILIFNEYIRNTTDSMERLYVSIFEISTIHELSLPLYFILIFIFILISYISFSSWRPSLKPYRPFSPPGALRNGLQPKQLDGRVSSYTGRKWAKTNVAFVRRKARPLTKWRLRTENSTGNPI